MARKPKSVADIDREIEALKAQRVAALEGRADQIGKIAGKAGLTTLEITDAELMKEFQAMADRFRRKTSTAMAQST